MKDQNRNTRGDMEVEDILKDPVRLKEYMLSVFAKGVDRGE